MTLQERITKLQEELQVCNANCAQWNEARLKTEGALIVLQRMLTEESEEAAKQKALDEAPPIEPKEEYPEHAS